MNTLEQQVVTSLNEASVGSVVWRYESERSRYEDGKYVGRGVWTAAVLTGESRASFEIGGSKFDRRTGAGRPYRGFSTSDRIAGRHERELFVYDQARWAIADKVKGIDIELLRRIADMIGWKP